MTPDVTPYQRENGKWDCQFSDGFPIGLNLPTREAAEKWAQERAEIQATKAAGKPVRFAGGTFRF